MKGGGGGRLNNGGGGKSSSNSSGIETGLNLPKRFLSPAAALASVAFEAAAVGSVTLGTAAKIAIESSGR